MRFFRPYTGRRRLVPAEHNWTEIEILGYKDFGAAWECALIPTARVELLELGLPKCHSDLSRQRRTDWQLVGSGRPRSASGKGVGGVSTSRKLLHDYYR